MEAISRSSSTPQASPPETPPGTLVGEEGWASGRSLPRACFSERQPVSGNPHVSTREHIATGLK